MEVAKVLKMFSLAYCVNSVQGDSWQKNHPSTNLFHLGKLHLKIGYDDKDFDEI